MGGKASKAKSRDVDVILEERASRRTKRAHSKPKTRRPTRDGQQYATIAQRPWSPTTPSPLSTTFTVSTGTSTSASHSRSTHQQAQATMSDNYRYNPQASQGGYNQGYGGGYNNGNHGYGGYQNQYQRPPEKDRRMIEAEKILEEIAKEYAAKRAAGLVPTKPVPARTLLWEEMAKSRMQAGRRGECVFGRDSDKICGCTSYKKLRLPGQDNPGGVCECCNHGAAWHRLVGGTMARSSRMSRSTIAGSTRGSRVDTMSSYVPSEARSSMYDYDSDEDYDEDEDEEAIANEMAIPSTFHPQPPPPAPYQPPHPQFGMQADRLSLMSAGSSFGFPSRLSSGTNSLGALLQAIQRYRSMGLDEDEIEARIRDDFPPVPRKSSVAARSDVSNQSQVDI